MTVISGVFNRPDGSSEPGVTIRFQLLENTSHSFINENPEVLTDEQGFYSIDLSWGKYCVTALRGWRKDVLGFIYVAPDGPDGTLNDYLLTGVPPVPAVIAGMEEMYFQMKALQGNPATRVQTEGDVPNTASGFYLVLEDNEKGAPTLYLYAGERRYWLAMVDDTQ
ncbi:MAG: prophage tail fiber N-terminal domain-containing protein [Scandinavium sp.]|uniref:prophage tail fiber N-terminal domain-containing protein n=1 Tax=Scandinavium sp. TaxID=2830653 RepID=UPI003F3512B2